jgi:hypothetical protein
MAKRKASKSLLAALREKPATRRGTATWFDRLDKKQQAEIVEIVQAFWDGSLPHTKTDIADWLIDRLKLSVRRQAVANFIDGRKPDGTRR